MNENDLRDCFAMFSMLGLVIAYKDNHSESELAQRAYTIADAMVEARSKEPKQEVGIVAAKKRRVK